MILKSLFPYLVESILYEKVNDVMILAMTKN